MSRQLFIPLAALTLLSGCAEQKNIVKPTELTKQSGVVDMFVLLPDPDGNVGEITISNHAGEITLSKANEYALVSDSRMPVKTKILTKKDVQKKFHRALQVIPGTADQYILYFTSGTTNLTEKSKNLLPKILRKIEKRLPCEIAIIGHADTKASSEYNLALSLKRAIEVKKELLAIGVQRELLEISSHGENDPLIPTGDNVSEAKNRRVEVFVR
ncbi:MAG: OmpA family protein [Candidatus Electrothrix sp. AR4]|nr:OmpA family protein [Candidatus Electrothrix sp. AR4]